MEAILVDNWYWILSWYTYRRGGGKGGVDGSLGSTLGFVDARVKWRFNHCQLLQSMNVVIRGIDWWKEEKCEILVSESCQAYLYTFKRFRNEGGEVWEWGRAQWWRREGRGQILEDEEEWGAEKGGTTKSDSIPGENMPKWQLAGEKRWSSYCVNRKIMQRRGIEEVIEAAILKREFIWTCGNGVAKYGVWLITLLWSGNWCITKQFIGVIKSNQAWEAWERVLSDVCIAKFDRTWQLYEVSVQPIRTFSLLRKNQRLWGGNCQYYSNGHLKAVCVDSGIERKN